MKTMQIANTELVSSHRNHPLGKAFFTTLGYKLGLQRQLAWRSRWLFKGRNRYKLDLDFEQEFL
jgi:hypothetical protein